MFCQVLESSEVRSRHRTEDLMNTGTLRVSVQCCGEKGKSERGKMGGGRVGGEGK